MGGKIITTSLLLGIGISAVTIAICKILDDKYNNLGGK